MAEQLEFPFVPGAVKQSKPTRASVLEWLFGKKKVPQDGKAKADAPEAAGKGDGPAAGDP